MNKYYGTVGYIETVEDPPDSGIWVENVTECNYYGDVIRNSKQWESGTSINDDLKVNNQISIIADPYANSHFFAMKYISWMGTLWKISNVEVQYPRLILSLGGVYNGKTA